MSFDVVGVLEHWQTSMARIACVEYQEHLDVGRLWYDLGQEMQTAWKLLAYEAAKVPDGDDPVQALASSIRNHRLWQLMVEPHWNRFVEILRQAPRSAIRIDPSEITVVRRTLADEFLAWMGSLGLEAIDSDDGDFTFYIKDWTVLVA